MQIHVTKDGQQYGPYPLSELQQHLSAGVFSPNDLGWYEGAANWLPLHSIPGIGAGAVPQSQSGPPPLPPLPSRPPKSSGVGIASLVLGILAFFTVGLTAIPAIICGHISLSKIKQSAGAIGGRGMTLAGLILGYFGVGFFTLAIVGAALPVFAEVNNRAKATESLANAKQIGLACQLYAGDHQGSFPPSLDELIPDYLPDNAFFFSPSAKDKSEISYEYISGLKVTDPPTQVLLREKNVPKRHYRAVIYVDLHGEAIKVP